MDGPQTLESGINIARKKFERNRIYASDGIRVDILEALEEFGIKTSTKMANERY